MIPTLGVIQVDRLNLYKGRPLKIADNLIIRHPTLDDIEELNFLFDIDIYRQYVHTLTLAPIDIADVLWCDMKIWYKDVTSWKLFIQLVTVDPTILDALTWFCGYDVALYLDENQEVVLFLPEINYFITEHTYMYISQFLRQINYVTPPKLNGDVEKAGNKLTAKYLLEKQNARRKREIKESTQIDLASITSLLQWEGKKGNEIWSYPIYRIYEGYMRLNLSDNYHKTMIGYYSGNLDLSKSKIDLDKLNWSQIIKF